MNKFIIILLFLSNSLFSQNEPTAINEDEKSSFIIGGTVNILVQNNSYPLSALGISSGIGGIGGIYSNSQDDIKNILYSFNPYLGYDLSPTWTMGVQLNARFGKYEIKDVDSPGQPAVLDFTRNSSQYGMGLFARKLFLEDSKFNLFIQPGIAYNIMTEEEEYDSLSSSKEKSKFLSASIGFGALYNINNRFRLTARLGGLSYAIGRWEVEGTSIEKDFNTFQTNFNLASVFFGLEIRM